MEEEKALRKEAAKEVKFYDPLFRGERKSRGWFERWMIGLSPFMPTGVEKILEAAGDLNGRRVLELGCGSGLLTGELARNGARVSAIDISPEACQRSAERNRQFIPHLVDIRPMDVCRLTFADKTFDLTVGISILHHVDLMRAVREIRRVLRPGGRGLFTEPLAHNFIANAWRKLTPTIRTENERPLTYAEIRKMGSVFSSVRYEEFALLTLLSSLVYLVTFSKKAKKKSAEWFGRIEHPFLRICKPLRRFSGLVLIEFTR
jgi:SAM-dependent methyltransferase